MKEIQRRGDTFRDPYLGDGEKSRAGYWIGSPTLLHKLRGVRKGEKIGVQRIYMTKKEQCTLKNVHKHTVKTRTHKNTHTHTKIHTYTQENKYTNTHTHTIIHTPRRKRVRGARPAASVGGLV